MSIEIFIQPTLDSTLMRACIHFLANSMKPMDPPWNNTWPWIISYSRKKIILKTIFHHSFQSNDNKVEDTNILLIENIKHTPTWLKIQLAGVSWQNEVLQSMVELRRRPSVRENS